MSKRKAEGHLPGKRDSEEESEEEYEKRRRLEHPLPLQQPDYPSYEEQPGPSQRIYPPPQPVLDPALSFAEARPQPQQPPTLHTRGPGRPRIHPPKPAGVSRPRGRPKGSKNKKPRKRKEVVRIERPPKRPRGRPRKWPPEMWEGFQRTREAAVQQQLKQQQQQQQQQQLHQQQHTPPQRELAGPSHMYMEQPGDPGAMVQMQMGPGLPHHLQHHPHAHLQQQQQQQSQPGPPPQLHQQQPHMPHYMQMPLETDQPQEFSLVMPRQSLPQELARQQQQQQQQLHHHQQQQQQQQMMPPMLLHPPPGAEERHPGEGVGEQEELLWMQQLPHPEDLPPPPPHTTS